jgi:hypothetical protein
MDTLVRMDCLELLLLLPEFSIFVSYLHSPNKYISTLHCTTGISANYGWKLCRLGAKGILQQHEDFTQ